MLYCLIQNLKSIYLQGILPTVLSASLRQFFAFSEIEKFASFSQATNTDYGPQTTDLFVTDGDFSYSSIFYSSHGNYREEFFLRGFIYLKTA